MASKTTDNSSYMGKVKNIITDTAAFGDLAAGSAGVGIPGRAIAQNQTWMSDTPHIINCTLGIVLVFTLWIVAGGAVCRVRCP